MCSKELRLEHIQHKYNIWFTRTTNLTEKWNCYDVKIAINKQQKCVQWKLKKQLNAPTLSCIPLEILCVAWPLVLSASLLSSRTIWETITISERENSITNQKNHWKNPYTIIASPSCSCRSIVCSINTSISNFANLKTETASLRLCPFHLFLLYMTHTLALPLYWIYPAMIMD